MARMQQYALYLAVALMPFQDTIVGKSPLGFVGNNVSSVPLMVYALIDFYLWLNSGKMTAPRSGFWWFFYALILSLVYIAVWGPISHGTSVIYKTFSMGLVFFLWAYTVFCIDYKPTVGLRRSTNVAFFLLIVGVFACDLRVPGLRALGDNAVVHLTTAAGFTRWRSFSEEPSMFSATAVSLGLASAYMARRSGTRIFVVILTLILLIGSGSKGGLLVIGISGFVILFLKKPSPLRATIYLAICVVLTGIVGLLVFRELHGVDLALATVSIATRMSLAVWTLIVMVHNPWGVGLSGFYEALTIYLPQAMDWLQRMSPVPLNFIEIQAYVYGNDLPLDAKCFLLEYLVSFGVPFLIAYLVFARRVLRALLERKQNILLVAAVFLLIGFSTYVNGLALYAGFYVMGLAYREYRLCRTERLLSYRANVAPTLAGESA